MPQPLPARRLPAAPETKRTSLALKSVSADGAFSGYASLFGLPDLGHDVVARGAFRSSLADRGPRGVRMLWQHDPAQPLGTWTSLVEDARGLYVRGLLNLDVPKAREVLALVRTGAIDGLSIGFRTVKGSRDPTTGLRRLTEIDLWEISIVTFPMQPAARIAPPIVATTPAAKSVATPLSTPTDVRLAHLMRAAARSLAQPCPHQGHYA